MENKVFLLLLSLFINSPLCSQFIFDDHYCEFYGSFEPFEYNENTNTFTFHLSETCDPAADGSFHALNLNTMETDSFQQDHTYDILGSDFEEGTPYHYCFRKYVGSSSYYDPNGTAYGGIRLNHDENKGRMLIVINDELQNQISLILEQYKMALIGDGWSVNLLTVNAGDSVSTIKQMIEDIYLTTDDLRSVFIIGEVAIPYSGRGISPDGHTEHSGAWMTDVYYADLDGNWTDETVNDVSSIFERHRNIPGDGKFDQSTSPSPSELEIGRIYFENLPIFSESPAELYERYFRKNINYRTGNTAIEKEIIVQSMDVYPEQMHQDLWLYSGAARDERKLKETGNLNLINETTTSSYRYGFGDSFGSANSCNGIVTSNQFKEDSLQVSFITLSGSYFGNWSYENNLLSVACASKGNTLVATWGNLTNPLHYLSSGQTFGFCQKMAMHGYEDFSEPQWYGFNTYPSNSVSNMLIGDPSLKTFVLPKVQSLNVTNDDSTSVLLDWSEVDSENIMGYNVYRASSLEEDFTKLNNASLLANTFEDINPLIGNNVYMVRAIRLDSSNVASFYTYSTGIIDSISFQYADSDMDGYTSDEDCDDNNPDVNPDATEVPYNGLDDDCNEETLDDDLDQDGFLLADDCDDENLDINPDAEEIPDNGIDEDCDGMDLTTGIHNLANSIVRIYPNPVSDVLYIGITAKSNFKISIFDLQGRLILEGENQESINVKSIPNGTYLLELKDFKTGQKIIDKIMIGK